MFSIMWGGFSIYVLYCLALVKESEAGALVTSSREGNFPGLDPSWYSREDLKVLQSYRIGAACTLSDGRPSICLSVSSCPAAVRGARGERCGDLEWVVCCPDAAPRFSPQNPPPKFASLPVAAPAWFSLEILPGRYTTESPRYVPEEPSGGVGGRAQQACLDFMSQASSGIVNYIRGGSEAGLGQFPHMALIGYEADENQNTLGRTTDGRNVSWRCGGTLVSDSFVLTAAHCVAISQPQVVRLGDLDWASDSDGASPQDVSIRRVVLQPEFRSQERYHDLALLELSTPVRLSPAVQPACLPSPGDTDLDGKKFTLTGWGDLEFMMDAGTSRLMTAQVSTVPLAECGRWFSGDGDLAKLPRGVATRGHLCARDLSGEADACQGDSGGPLQELVAGSPLYRVVGVVSIGKSCDGVAPGLYAKVADYVGWIEAIVWP